MFFDSLKQTNVNAAGTAVAAAASATAATIPNNQVKAATNLNGNSVNNNVKTSTIVGTNGNANNGTNGLGAVIGDEVSKSHIIINIFSLFWLAINHLTFLILKEVEPSQALNG